MVEEVNQRGNWPTSLHLVHLAGVRVVGFVDFCAEDQATLIRLGQSSSRILAACIHWYDAELMDFKNFLSWRSSDLFKRKSVRHAQKMHALDIDPIEAALLNVATLIATGMCRRAFICTAECGNPLATGMCRRAIICTAECGNPHCHWYVPACVHMHC